LAAIDATRRARLLAGDVLPSHRRLRHPVLPIGVEALPRASGSICTDDEASFRCEIRRHEPKDLEADSRTARLQHEAP